MQEFDVLQQNTLSVTGNFIEYTALVQSEGALRSGNDAINIRADGELVGILRPGESLTFKKSYKRWEITTVGYARVRIGNGNADFVAARGITTVESAYRTLRGNEYEGSVKSGSGAGFNYCGFVNSSTDKIIMVSLAMASIAATNEFIFTFATIPTPVPTADVVMNKHSEVVETPWITPVSGVTAALAPTAGEMVLIGENTYHASIVGVRTQSIAVAGGPFAVAPGRAFVIRSSVSAVAVALRASMTSLTYGTR